MTDRTAPEGKFPKRRESGAVARDFFTPYLIVGVVLGILSGIFAVSVHKLLKDEMTILLATAGSAVALLAVILTATALIAGFLQNFFGLVIQTAAGLRAFFRPFRIMARVSAAAALVSFAGAMDADSGAEWLRATLFGLASGLTTWAIVGIVWLISVFVRYAVKQREMATEEEEEEEAREGEDSTRPPPTPPKP